MKKYILLLIILIIPFTAYSKLDFTGFGGYNFILSDIEGLDNSKIENNNIIFGLKAGFTIPVLTVGLITGYMPLYSYDLPAAKKYSVSAIPFIIYGQLTYGPLYALGGIGPYLMFYNSEDTSETDLDWGYSPTLGMGFYPFRSFISIDVGTLFQIMDLEHDTIYNVAIIVGIKYSL